MDFFTKVVGVTHRNRDGADRQRLVAGLSPGDPLTLAREPGNRADPNAVAVRRAADGAQLGYLPADVAAQLAFRLDRGERIGAVVADVTGGTPGKPTRGVNVRLFDGRAVVPPGAAATLTLPPPPVRVTCTPVAAQTPPPAPAQLDDAVLRRFTGQTEVRDPAHADAMAAAHHAEVLRLTPQVDAARKELRRRSFRLALARSRVEPWAGGLAAGAVVGFGAAMACFAVAGSNVPAVMGTMLVGFAAAGFGGYSVMRDLDGETPETRVAHRTELVRAAQEHLVRLANRRAQARRSMDEWRNLAYAIREALAFPLARLLNARCDQMDGGEFEAYLAEVFRFLGYGVEQLGGAGDQGVDLILTRPADGARVAVQAKCWQAPVGNTAVQEVYAGRAVHRCDRWAVVTNSTFTAGGREAAAATGTALVDGSQLPDLIRGQIVL